MKNDLISKSTPFLYASLNLVFSLRGLPGIPSFIIPTEEFLISANFFGFIFFIYKYFGGSIKESLDQTSLSIKGELEASFQKKKKSIIQLYKEHEKVSFLNKGVASIISLTRNQLTQASVESIYVLYGLLCQQIRQKLSTFLPYTACSLLEWQQQIATSLRPLLLLSLENQVKQGESSPETKITQKGIQLLIKKNKNL